VPAGTFSGVLAVIYAIDYGIYTEVNETGETPRYARTFDYGVIYYAPAVGPIETRERRFVPHGVVSEGDDGEARLDMVLREFHE